MLNEGDVTKYVGGYARLGAYGDGYQCKHAPQLVSCVWCDTQAFSRLYYRLNGAAAETYALGLIRGSIISSYLSWLTTTILTRRHGLVALSSQSGGRK
jgi:hypothetical protein